ncbi:hypothetical protein GN958_ATG19019, partial [Phytophthora infestans]
RYSWTSDEDATSQVLGASSSDVREQCFAARNNPPRTADHHVLDMNLAVMVYLKWGRPDDDPSPP